VSDRRRLRLVLAVIGLAALIVAMTARAGMSSAAKRPTPGGTIRAGSPVKGVNAVIPKFEVAFAYPEGHQRAAPQLTKVLIRPPIHGATVIGGCQGCQGGGQFTAAQTVGNLRVIHIKGKLRFSARTRLVIGYVRGIGIGRFRLYGVSLHPAELKLLKQGCLAAGTISIGNGETSAALLGDLLKPKSLPEVPCSAHTPTTDNLRLSAPLELSTSTATTGRVAGRVSGDRWLTVFQSHHGCAPDPLDETLTGFNPQVFAVHGTFDQSFSAGTDTRPGVYCAYLQIGGRFNGIPTGRVTTTWESSYLGGDSFSLAAPAQVLGGQAVQATASGVAASTEQVWMFASDAPCATTAQAEATEQLGSTSQVVKGTYSVPFTTGPLTQSANICAYVQSHASKTKPSGVTLFSQGTPVTLAVGSLALSGPTTVAFGTTLATVVAGTTSVPATVWSFTSFSPCAATAAAEYPSRYGETTIAVAGSFSEQLTSPAVEQSPGPLYRCDYLLAGTSLSGAALAAASQTITEEYVQVALLSTTYNGDEALYNITGNAAATENVWLFTSADACQATAQNEYAELGHGYGATEGPGSISQEVSSRALTPGQWNVCVYLQSGAAGATPSGSVITGEFATFNVA
jgi:hypothetical protein